MPIWGHDRYGDGEDERAHRQAGDRVSSLVAYLETIQPRELGRSRSAGRST
jgi:hypothetical protein